MTQCFVVESLRNRTGRLDAHFFNPQYHETVALLEKAVKDNPRWDVRRMGELLRSGSRTNLTGGVTPTGARYVSEGITFLRVQNIGAGRFLLDDVVYVDVETHNTLLKRSQLRSRDVVLTITGSYGNSCVVPEGFGAANINQHCVKIEVDDDSVEPTYLSAFLNSRLGRVQMDGAVTGSSRPALDYSAVKSLRILIPTPDERRDIILRIAELEMQALALRLEKKTLLDGIDNLVLEELGISMPKPYAGRSFIVTPSSIDDCLDVARQDPYLAAIIDVLGTSEYEVKRLMDLADVETPTRNPRLNPESLFRLVELEDIDSEVGEITAYKERYGAQFNGSKRAMEPNTLAVSRLRFYLRKVALVPNDWPLNTVGSTELFLVRPHNGTNSVFLREMLRHRLLIDQAGCHITGSTRPRVNADDLKNLLLPAPPSDTQDRIGKRLLQVYEEAADLSQKASSIESEAAIVTERALLGSQGVLSNSS